MQKQSVNEHWAGTSTVQRPLPGAPATDVRWEEQSAADIIASLPDPLVCYDLAGTILHANPAFALMTPATATELVGTSILDLFPDHERDEVARSLTDLAVRGRTCEDRIRLAHRVHAADRVVEWLRRPIAEDGVLVAVVAQGRDVTDQHLHEQALVHDLWHDALTGCLSRTGLEQRLSRMWQAVPGQAPPVLVVYLDLDDFKAVNDTRGHAAGDALLIAVGEQLRRSTRQQDLVGRLGGDEFVIVLRDCGDDPAGLTRVRQLVDAVSGDPDRTGAGSPCSHGIAAPAPGESWSSVLDRADRAMLDDKRLRHARGAR